MTDRLRRGRGESGQAAVELALVLPLVLTVLLAAVQFALVHHAQNVVETASAEGTRLAATASHSLGDGATRSREILTAGLGASGASFDIEIGQDRDLVVTEVRGSYRLFIPWVRDLEIPLRARSEVRREGLRRGP